MVLDVITETLEDISVGETLKHSLKQNQIAQVQKHVRQEEVSKKVGLGNDGSQEVRPEKIVDQSNFFFPFDLPENAEGFRAFFECVKHVTISFC